MSRWSATRCALPSRERVALLRALVQSSVVGRPESRPTAGESFALALLTSSGTSRDAGPFQSHPRCATHRVATGGHPAWHLSIWNPAVAVVPTPPRLLATRTASRPSLSLGHCSVPVATSSRPDWVPGCRRVIGWRVWRALSPKNRRVRGTRAREAGAFMRQPRLGRTEVRWRSCCGCGAGAVLWRSRIRSNIPFAPDRVAVLSRSTVLLRSRFAVLVRPRVQSKSQPPPTQRTRTPNTPARTPRKSPTGTTESTATETYSFDSGAFPATSDSSAYSSRRSFFENFPVAVFGISSMKSTSSGAHHFGNSSFTIASNSSVSTS